MHVADEHGGPGLPFEVVDPAADCIDGQAEPLGCGAKAAAACNLQENAGRVPIGEPAESDPLAFLRRNAPFHCQTHTISFRMLNLAESGPDHNHGGLAAESFA